MKNEKQKNKNFFENGQNRPKTLFFWDFFKKRCQKSIILDFFSPDFQNEKYFSKLFFFASGQKRKTKNEKDFGNLSFFSERNNLFFRLRALITLDETL